MRYAYFVYHLHTSNAVWCFQSLYQYREQDSSLVLERVAQYRGQTKRYLAGQLSEEEFRPLRLMNGLYIQTHAPMLRIAIPYGLLSSNQLRTLADITERFDRGYGHFTTRQNLQLNWVRLEEVPDLLEELAHAGMHAIQTSGNCIRNVTTDHLAGVTPDEVEDPRPWCELLREWSTFHPEFSFLPRKFKIAVCGAEHDRAATLVHDIGIYLRRAQGAGGIVADLFVGGGLGRTPIIGKLIGGGVQRADLLPFMEAIMRVYNLHGRRDNKYKARIKILVQSLGADEFRRQVLAEYEQVRKDVPPLDEAHFARIAEQFAPPLRPVPSPAAMRNLEKQQQSDGDFAEWYQHNTVEHKVEGYRAVYLSLKPLGGATGDLNSEQMRAVAALADEVSFGELRVTHTQNLLFGDVPIEQLGGLWQALKKLGLARANIDTISDIICCPGLDYCGLANTGTIGVTQDLDRHLVQEGLQQQVGDVKIKISGCMNACGHHHVGHIGILGVEKKGEEWYQLQLGGSAEEDASLGKVLGPAVPKAELSEAIAKLVRCYLQERQADDESFLACVRRVGYEPFKQVLYATDAG